MDEDVFNSLEDSEIELIEQLSTDELEQLAIYLKRLQTIASTRSLSDICRKLAVSVSVVQEVAESKAVEATFAKTAYERLLQHTDFQTQILISDWLREAAGSDTVTAATDGKTALTQLADSLVKMYEASVVSVETKTLDQPEDWEVQDITSTLSIMSLALHRRAQVEADNEQTSAQLREEARFLTDIAERLRPLVE